MRDTEVVLVYRGNKISISGFYGYCLVGMPFIPGCHMFDFIVADSADGMKIMLEFDYHINWDSNLMLTKYAMEMIERG